MPVRSCCAAKRGSARRRSSTMPSRMPAISPWSESSASSRRWEWGSPRCTASSSRSCRRCDQLPEPQREALESAFGLRSDGRGDVFLVGLAALTLLGDAARDRPLLCVVDDTQWLDRESINVLAFVARRVYADQIALLFAVREPSEPAVPIDGVADLHLRGLDDGDARELLSSVVGGPLGPLARGSDRERNPRQSPRARRARRRADVRSPRRCADHRTASRQRARRGSVPAAGTCVAARHADAPARRRR